MSIKADEIIAVRKSKKVYRDGNTVIKVFDEDYSKSKVLNEALNQARAEETGLVIPKILEVMIIDGKWAIRSEYIKGRTLQQLMDAEPEKFDEYMNFFVDLQISVHEKTAPLLGKLSDKLARKIDATDFDSTIKYELQERLGGMPKHKKVCHGDFDPSNIIISDDDGKAYILDWAHVTQGNASADVARTYLLFCLNSGKETADKYLDLFCQKTNTEKQYVQKWLSIVAAAQTVNGDPAERDLLLSWVNVVDFE